MSSSVQTENSVTFDRQATSWAHNKRCTRCQTNESEKFHWQIQAIACGIRGVRVVFWCRCECEIWFKKKPNNNNKKRAENEEKKINQNWEENGLRRRGTQFGFGTFSNKTNRKVIFCCVGISVVFRDGAVAGAGLTMPCFRRSFKWTCLNSVIFRLWILFRF